MASNMPMTATPLDDASLEADGNESLLWADEGSVVETIRRQMREQRAARFWVLMATSAILATISVVGTAGNALTVFVFGWRLPRSTPNVLICVLSGVDLVIDLVVIPASIADVWEAELHNEASCRASHMLRIAVVMFETFVLILIALDRYLRICFIPPVRLRRLHLRLILALFALLALLLGFPPALSMSIHVTALLSDGVDVEAGEQLLMKSCKPNQEILSAEILSYYWFAIAIVFIASILVTSFFYISIFVVVYFRSSIFRRNTASLQNSLNAVTYTTAAAPPDIVELQKRLRSHITPLAHEERNKPQLRESDPTTPTHSEPYAIRVTPPEEASTPKSLGPHSLVINLAPSNQQKCSLTVASATSRRSLNSEVSTPCGDFNSSSEAHFNRNVSAASKLSAFGDQTCRTHAHHQHNRRGAHRRPHMKTVLVTLLVTLSFAVSYTPLILMHSHIIKFWDGGSGAKSSSSALYVLYYLYFLQNALNPITYAVMNPAFRTALLGLFACWFSRPATKRASHSTARPTSLCIVPDEGSS